MTMSKPGWERCKELAEQDRLTESEVIELTGLAPDAGLLRELLYPCSHADLVLHAAKNAIKLPSKFLYSEEHYKPVVKFNRWRDDWIAALKRKGIADTPLNYGTFLALTTFNESNLDEDAFGYQLVRDPLGDVIGIASNYKLENYADGGLKVEADIRAASRLDFPTTAQELIVWIRNQGGAVELTGSLDDNDADADAFAELLPLDSLKQPAVTDVRSRRDNPGRDAILAALRAINATIASDPRQIDGRVRDSLLETAMKAKPEAQYPFQNSNGTLKVLRAGKWVEYDREALVKRIANALPSLSDSSQ